MTSLVFLFLGLGAMLAIGGVFDGSSDTDEPDDEQDQRIEVNDGDTVKAGDGDDTLIGVGNADGVIETAEARGGDGDDFINFGELRGTHDLFGGDGNDTLVGLGGYASELSGGDGNDVLTGGGDSIEIAGGAGDDDLTIHAASTEEGNSAFGGSGDDSLTAVSDLRQDPYGSASSILTGGAGEDTFTLALQSVRDPATDPDDPAYGSIPRLMTVSDFDLGNEQLVLDLSELPDSGPQYSGFEISTIGSGSTVTLTFGNGATAEIHVNGVAGLTTDHISVLR